MRDSIRQKLTSLKFRYEELAELLNNTEIISDNKKFVSLSKEYSDLETIITLYNEFSIAEQQIEDNNAMIIAESDSNMKELLEEDLKDLKETIKNLEERINFELIPRDPNDTKNIFLEIRSGAGGDEASIFVGDLFRMYAKYAEQKNWKASIISSTDGEHGGYKELVAQISGNNVFGDLKFESGCHRVQRVPKTESQGRVHTSTCTVAIMPEVDEIHQVEINPQDLRVDTYRSSGAGGQHVNTTDSAIRITHIPTGVVVECQEDRSQHKNRAKAMSVLQMKLYDHQVQSQKSAQDNERRGLIGSGDRSERIRTYNFPQGRVTDHRINLTLYRLDDLMEGDIALVIEPLQREAQLQLMQNLGD